MTVGGISVAWWLQFLLVCLVLTGAGVVARGLWRGLAMAWEWARRDRVTPLLGPDEETEQEQSGLCAGCWDNSEHCDGAYDTCDCTCGWNEDWAEGELPPPLPPERTWEQMTSHQLPPVPALVTINSRSIAQGYGYLGTNQGSLAPERERRALSLAEDTGTWRARVEEDRRAWCDRAGLDYEPVLLAVP